MANFTQDRMYDMLGEISKKQKPNYRQGGSLNSYAKGGDSCEEGYVKDANGNCITQKQYNEQLAQQQLDNAKDFTNQYFQSPMYNQMLQKSAGDNYENIKESREENLEDVSNINYKDKSLFSNSNGTAIGYSNAATGKITLGKDGLTNKGVAVHELSHSTDAPVNFFDKLFSAKTKRLIPESDKELIEGMVNKEFHKTPYFQENRSRIMDFGPEGFHEEKKAYDDYYKDYVGQPTETRARLMEIRKAASDAYQKDPNAMYDPFNQEVTPETYQKLLKHDYEPAKDDNRKWEKKFSSPLEELKGIYTDEEIMKLLNTVAENQSVNDRDPNMQTANTGGQMPRYAPGGESSDGPGDSKKKPPRDSNRILPRWMSDDAIRAIQNTEVGINPYMSNMQSMPEGMLTGEGSKNYSVSRPFYGVTTETGLGKRKINKSDSKGWSLGTYVGKPYDDSSGDAYGKAIEDAGQEAHDMKWDEYNQNLADYEAGTMSSSMLYGEDGWDPEKNKPKYDGKKLTALGRAMQKSPLVGGLSFNYQHPIIKQPNGYNAGGKGKISLDFDPNNQVGVGLEGGIDFYGGSKRKDYRPGQSKWSINPKLMVSLGTRPVYGAGITAGIEGLPEFMPKNFPGYFHANANYSQSFVLPTPTFSANAGINFPLTDLRKRRAQSRVIQKEEEDGVRNTTYEYGGNVKNEKVTLLNKFFRQ